MANRRSRTLRSRPVKSSSNSAGGLVEFNAQTILLDNKADVTEAAVSGGGGGELRLNGSTVELGANSLNIDQFATVDIAASGGFIANGVGTFAVGNALSITTPVITAAKGANPTISAAGDLALSAPANGRRRKRGVGCDPGVHWRNP